MANPFLSSLIAKRLTFRKGRSFSSNVIRISAVSIALGTIILVLSVAIQQGFRNEIYERIFSFGGHISLRQFSSGTLYEELPLSQQEPFLLRLRQRPEIAYIQSFSFKPALLSNEKEVAGVILKGVDKDFNIRAFAPNLRLPKTSGPGENTIWISEKLASKLNLKTGMPLTAFFLQEPPRYRKLKIDCIYQTGLEDIDDNIAFVPIELLREINGWEKGTAGGFEVFLKDFETLGPSLESIGTILPYNLAAEPVTHTHSQLFEWLDVIGRNVLVMFVLISIVAGFNMAATLLIMVMERRQMIGILKALGADDGLIRSVFVQNGLKIMFRGLLAGNVLGIGMAWIQWKFHVIPLNPDSYYLSSVPIGWNWFSILGINLGVVLITWLVILIPVRMVNRIRPAEAVRN
jgi:lipoprotein-releasing system permease protein